MVGALPNGLVQLQRTFGGVREMPAVASIF